ncbi:hypothetical protein GCM10009647_079750 [Streptomyces sanglieri]
MDQLARLYGVLVAVALPFRQVHLEDMGRVRTRKVCSIDDEFVPQEEIGKGYELTKDDLVAVTDEELDEMPLPTAKAIEIVAFVDADSIDPIRISDSYYLAIDGQVAAKPYTLLRKALERSDKVAVAKFAWHNRVRLGLLRVRDDAIVLHAMRRPGGIRSPESLKPKDVDLDEEEIERAAAGSPACPALMPKAVRRCPPSAARVAPRVPAR